MLLSKGNQDSKMKMSRLRILQASSISYQTALLISKLTGSVTSTLKNYQNCVFLNADEYVALTFENDSFPIKLTMLV